MITIGKRTKSKEAEPGFSYGELTTEVERRNISYLGKSRDELLDLLSVPNIPHDKVKGGIPGVLIHRSLVVRVHYGIYLYVQDFDTGKVLMEKGVHGIEPIGMMTDG